jgi:hypothetical protein
MAQGIGGPMGAPVLICLNPSYTASKWVHAHAHAHRLRAMAQVCTQAAAPLRLFSFLRQPPRRSFKMYSSVFAFNGWLYSLRVTSGTSGGGGALPVAFPTVTQSTCNTGTTLTQINGAFTNNAQLNGGWAQHAMVWTTSSAPGQPPIS